MFKIEYILQLLSGNLTEKGYKSFLSGVSSLVKKYHWSRNVIISENPTTDYWSAGDIKELTQQFFEYAIIKNKLSYLGKIPVNYLEYYFLQIFISFIATRISEEQQKHGLSFEKCKELVLVIVKEKYISSKINNIEYVSKKTFSANELIQNYNYDSELKYLSPVAIKEDTKHFKPLVTIVLEDIFNLIVIPIPQSKLIETVYKLLDQSTFANPNAQEEYDEQTDYDIDENKYKSEIQNILNGLSKNDAKLISEYLFQTQNDISLSSLADKYGLPKSSIGYKVEQFRKKVIQNHIPENKQDGICFIKNLSDALDEMAN